MNISRNDSGEYIATPKDVWTVGSFITRRNSDTHDGFNEYGDEIIPLDITYKKRPCISIEDFSCNNPEETSTEDVVKSDIKIYLKIDGGFFMNNAEISITNEYISKTDNEQTNNQIFLLKQVFPTYSLYHDNKRYWFTDGTLKQEYNKIISYTDSTKGDAVSREATISFSCNLEHDGTRLSTGKLNYKLLHNGKVSLNLIE